MSKIQDFSEELSTLIRAKYSLVAIESSEEQRAINLVREAAMGKANAQVVYEWSATLGMRDEKGKPFGHDGKKPSYSAEAALIEIDQMELPKGTKAVYILKDFHKFMADNQHMIHRRLRDLATGLKWTSKTIVFISPVFKVPGDLQKSISVLDLPLPDKAELETILCEALEGLKRQEATLKDAIHLHEGEETVVADLKGQLQRVQTNRVKMNNQRKSKGDRIISAGLGLTAIEFEDVIAKCFVNGDLDVRLILSEKKQIIKKSGLMEYIDAEETAQSIGGLKVLKQQISTLAFCLSEKAREFGIEASKGFLLIGIPGGGKSLSAKVCSRELQLPIVRLDVGSLFGSLVGESENRTRQALKLTSAIAPCILWIDEIEKGMNFGSGAGDSGTSQRIFATILTWMEESSDVFVVATCNSHTALKPELMARFQRIFFIDVPTAKERREILTIHLAKVKRNPADFDMDALVAASEGFVGREIRNIVQDSLRAAFVEGEGKTDYKLTTEHIVAQFGKTKPITIQKEDELKSMREWADGNATNASEKEPSAVPENHSSSAKGRFEGGLELRDLIT
jgi:ATP-dependent 26S proteasome regulatory subunit